MGFFDARCMVTGVSLKGSGAALILLQQTEAAYHPFALAITGQYDRLGSIDMIDEDDNTALILRYFLSQLGTGAFTVDAESLKVHESYPIETIEHLLRGFERNLHDGPGYAALNGKPIVFALIATTVWNAIARAAKPPTGDDRTAFRELFKEVLVAEEIYDEHLEDVSQHLHEFAAVRGFLVKRKILWKPAEDAYQHYGKEMQQFLTEARNTFQDSPDILKTLKQYQREVSDLLED